VLLLAIPFGLYVAWQVQSTARADIAAPEPPPEKGVPGREQLTASRAKAEKWVGDVRRASAVALQYRAPGGEDRVEDPACAAVVKSASARSADLTDLEKFVADDKGASFTGSLKEQYADWTRGRKELGDAAAAIETWLRSPLSPAVDSPQRAADAMRGFALLVGDYRKDLKFANLAKVAAWEVEARVKVIEALDEAATRPYDEALNLPLASVKGNKLVEKAVGLPGAIREQVKLLQADVLRAEDARRPIPDRVRKAADAVIRSAREWETKEQLLTLCADPELFTDPSKAADWIPKIHEQYLRTQDPKVKPLILKKVREFCDGYVPQVARLDSQVLYKGKEVPRSVMTIEYNSDAKVQPLTDHPTRLNEFNFADFYPGFDSIAKGEGDFTGTKSNLQPTDTSRLARDFTEARKDVITWSAEAVNRLKKKCEGEDEALQQKRRTLTDTLVGAEPVKDPRGKEPPSNWTRENTRIWTRLEALSKAIEQHPTLFEKKP
jgi:hypothetical protein